MYKRQLLGRLLFELHEALPFCIISVDGGDKDNAIPVDSKAEIVVSDEDIDEIQSLAAAFQEKVRSEFHVCCLLYTSVKKITGDKQ